jgi:uncharacterized protein YggT (Ycf19 family)
VGIVCIVILLLQLVLVATIVTSWFAVQPGTAMESVARGLRSVTDPALAPLRGVFYQLRLGGRRVDTTPVVVVIVLFIARLLLGC